MKKISEITIMGPGEKEVVSNAIFYKIGSKGMGYQSGVSFTGSGEVSIVPYRVITVNTSARHFRLRNLKGCEYEYSLKDGCIKDLYATLADARKAAEKLFDYDIENHTKRLEKAKIIKTSLDILKKKQKSMKTLKPTKEPKKV